MAFLFLTLFWSLPSWAANYYVNASADSGGNGTTTDLKGAHCAFKTIAQVNDKIFSPGDFIYFNRGDTWREQLVVSSSGASAKPITFTNYGTGNLPLILGSNRIDSWNAYSGSIYRASCSWLPYIVFQDGLPLARKTSLASLIAGSFFADTAGKYLYVWCTDSSDPSGHTMEAGRHGTEWYGLVTLVSKNNVTFDGIELRYANYFSFCDSGGKNNIFKNNVVSYGYTQGMWALNTANVTITDNYIHHSGLHGLDGMGAGITVCGGNSFTVSGNNLKNTYGEGIVIIASVSNLSNGAVTYNRIKNPKFLCGIVLDALGGYTLQGVTVLGNDIWATEKAAGVVHGIQSTIESAQYTGYIYDCSISHNIIHGFHNGHGFLLGYKGTGAIQNNTFHNNVIYDCIGGIYIFGQQTQITGNSIRNNIVYITGPGYPLYLSSGSSTDNSLDHNLYYKPSSTNTISWLGSAYTLAKFKTSFGRELHSIDSNPLFSGISTWTDFRLQTGSPAIDAGSNLGETYQNALDPNDLAWPPSSLNQNSYGTGWEMGAFVYATGKSISATANLQIYPNQNRVPCSHF
jgi:hypothetical protein